MDIFLDTVRAKVRASTRKNHFSNFQQPQMIVPFAVPYVLPAVSSDELYDYEIELPSVPITPPAFESLDAENKYWHRMNRWYIPCFVRQIQALNDEQCKYPGVHKNPLMLQIRSPLSVEASHLFEEEDAAKKNVRSFKEKGNLSIKYEFLRSEYECLTKLRWIRELDAEFAATTSASVAPATTPAPVAPFLVPEGDLRHAEFVVPSAPIVPPVFSSLDEEFSYWQKMKRWYITSFRSYVLLLEGELRLSPLVVEFDELEAHEDEELAILSAEAPSCARDKKQSIVSNKYSFLRDEHMWLARLERARKATKAAAATAAPASAPVPAKRTIIDLSSDSEEEPEPKRVKHLEDEDPEFAEFLRAVEGPRSYKNK